MESAPLREVDTPTGQNKNSKVLSFSCDQILSSLHSHEEYRDAVVGSNANEKSNAILFILNPDLKDLKGFADCLRKMDCVQRLAVGSKKHPKTGEEMRLMKVQIRSSVSSQQNHKPILQK